MAIAGSMIGAILGALAVLITFAATPVGFAVCEHGCSLGLYFLIGAVGGAALGGVVAAGVSSGATPGGEIDPVIPDRKR